MLLDGKKGKKVAQLKQKIKKTFYQNSTNASDDIQSCFVPKKRDKHLPNRYLSVNEKKVFFPARAPWLKLFDCKFYDLKEIKLKNNHQLGKIIKKVYRYSKFI